MTRKNGKNKDVESALEQEHKLVDRQQHKHLLNNNNNNNNDKTVLAAQHESEAPESKNNNNKPQVMAFCSRQRWLLLLSMGITFIIGLVLLVLLAASLLDKREDKSCFDAFPFEQPSYKLFSTKTSYSTAFNYLNTDQVFASTHTSSHQYLPLTISHQPEKLLLQQQQHQRSHSIEIPTIFARTQSLRSIHDKLTSESCSVKQLHYFGRHSSRYPSSHEVEFINKHLASVQQRIEPAKFSVSNQASQSSPPATNDSLATLCLNPMTPYKQWVTPLAVERGNLLMESGLDEALAIAQRLRSIYPRMFDSNSTKIELGTTDELRTAQTATAFLELCNNNNNPQDKTTNDECQKEFLAKHTREKLQFHKRCESYHKTNLTIQYDLNVDAPVRTKFIVDSLSKKLKFNEKDEMLDFEEAQAIYKICKYESALVGSSIWCNLFQDSDLKFYEYLNDIGDFYNHTYGHPNLHKSACPVTGDLYKAFKSVRLQDKPESYFYFTHSQVIQKIFAASVDLEKDPAYSTDVIRHHLKSGTVPEPRQWRTSLLTPFAANLAFTLYECPTTSGSSSFGVRDKNNDDNKFEFDVNPSLSNYKLVASLNEQPILLDGCSDTVCNLNQLLEDSRLFEVKRCKLEDICRSNIIVT